MTDWHPYAHLHQRRAAAILAVLGVAAAWVTSSLLRWAEWTPPWWFDAPAVLGWYGILFWAFDSWIWRIETVARAHGIRDLSGEYRVHLRSSFDDFKTLHEATAKIVQTWSRMSIQIAFKESNSSSTRAILDLTPEGGVRVIFTYDNDPHPSATKAMERHGGTTIVIFDSARRGRGAYYSGRGRENHGEIEFNPAA